MCNIRCLWFFCVIDDDACFRRSKTCSFKPLIKEHINNFEPFSCSFYSLEKLSLKDNCLSDVGVKKLTLPQRLLKDGLRKLSVLDLSLNPGISDSSIKYLIKINSFTALNLSGTGVTFRCGVPQLANQTNLCLSLEVSYTVWLNYL